MLTHWEILEGDALVGYKGHWCEGQWFLECQSAEYFDLVLRVVNDAFYRAGWCSEAITLGHIGPFDE